MIDKYQKAFEEVFRHNKPHFAGDAWPEEGRTDYYGLEVTKVKDDVVHLTWTFKATERYCCAESGCHVGFGARPIFSKKAFDKLRDHLTVDVPKPIAIDAKFIVEKGCLLDRMWWEGDKGSEPVEETYQYNKIWIEPGD